MRRHAFSKLALVQSRCACPTVTYLRPMCPHAFSGLALVQNRCACPTMAGLSIGFPVWKGRPWGGSIYIYIYMYIYICIYIYVYIYVYIYIYYIYTHTSYTHTHIYIYTGGPRMRSLIPSDFLALKMEPQSARGMNCPRSLAPMLPSRCSTTQATFTNPSLLRATPRYSATPRYVFMQTSNVIGTVYKRWRSKKTFKTQPFHVFS